jgi:GTPase SAR1 family protein
MLGEEKGKEWNMKVVLSGSRGTGKTTLMLTYLKEQPVGMYSLAKAASPRQWA